MFTVEIGGRTFSYATLERLAAYCYEMARSSRSAADNVVSTKQFYVGKAEAYGSLAIAVESIRIAGLPVEKYIEDITAAAQASAKREIATSVELHSAYTRIAELEKLLQTADHIGDAR